MLPEVLQLQKEVRELKEQNAILLKHSLNLYNHLEQYIPMIDLHIMESIGQVEKVQEKYYD